MVTDRDAAVRAVRDLLSAVGLDPDAATLSATPGLVADSMIELFSGVCADPDAALSGAAPVEGVYPGPVAVTGIPFSSTCEHHLLPFHGTADVVYLPTERLAGIGDFDAMIRVVSARPQMQERLTQQIDDSTRAVLAPLGSLVRLRARHACMYARGERTVGATVTTIAASGRYAAGPERADALALVGP